MPSGKCVFNFYRFVADVFFTPRVFRMKCRLSFCYLSNKSTLVPRTRFLMKINNELLRGEITVTYFRLCIYTVKSETSKLRTIGKLMIIGISLVFQSSLPLRQYGSPLSAHLFESISKIFPRPTFRIQCTNVHSFNSTRRQCRMHIAANTYRMVGR
jgi:hypothetical protein